MVDLPLEDTGTPGPSPRVLAVAPANPAGMLRGMPNLLPLLLACVALASPLPGATVSAPPPSLPVAALAVDGPVTSITWSPDGTALLASADGGARALSVTDGTASDVGALVPRAVHTASGTVRVAPGGLVAARADGAVTANRASLGGVQDLLGSTDGAVAWSADGVGAVVAWDVDRGVAFGAHVIDGAHRLLGVSADGTLAAIATEDAVHVLGKDGDRGQVLPHGDVHDAAVDPTHTALATRSGLFVYRNDTGVLAARTATTTSAVAWIDDDVLAIAGGRTVRVWDIDDDLPKKESTVAAGVRGFVPVADGQVAVWTSTGAVHGLDAKGKLSDACVDGVIAAAPWALGRRRTLLAATSTTLAVVEPRKCRSRGRAEHSGPALVAAGAGPGAWAVDATCGRWAWAPDGALTGSAGDGTCDAGIVSPMGAAVVRGPDGLSSRDAVWNPRPLLGVPGRIATLVAGDDVVATLDDAGGLSLWDAGSLTPRAVRATDAAHVALAPGGQPAIAAHKEVAALDPGSLQTTRRWGAEEPGALAWSADGSRLAYVDGTAVVIVDPRQDAPVKRWSETGPIGALAWHPDGGRVAVGVGRTVVLRDPDGERIGVAPAGEVTALAWSPDGAHLAVGDAAGRVRVDAADAVVGTGAPLAVGGPVRAATFSPDGSTWTVGGPSGRVVRSGGGVDAVAQADGPIAALAETDRVLVATDTSAGWWTPGLRWLWAAAIPRGSDLEIAGDRWVERGEKVWVRGVPELADTPVTAAALAPDGTLAIAHEGMRLLRPGQPEEGVALPGPAALLDWSPDGGTLAVATTDGDIALVDPETGEARVVRNGVGQPSHLAVGDGTRGYVVAGGAPGRAWQFGTWASKSPTEGVEPLALVGLGDDHVLLPLDGTLQHTDLRGGRKRDLEWTGPPLAWTTLGADGRALLVGQDGSWTVWDPRRRKTRSYGTQALTSVAMDRTGRFIAVGTTTGDLWTWSLDRGAPTAVQQTGGGSVVTVDVDALGRVLWADRRAVGLESRRWFIDATTSVAIDGDRVLAFAEDQVVVIDGSDRRTVRLEGLGAPRAVVGAGYDWSALAEDGRRLAVELDRKAVGQAAASVPRPGRAGGIGAAHRAVVDPERGTVTVWGGGERTLAVDAATAATLDDTRSRVWTAGSDGAIRSFDLASGTLRSVWWVGPDGQWAAWDDAAGWRSGGLAVTTW